jgi:hypothetical protein
MKLHTTNYTNTFIEVAEDCPATIGIIPPIKGDDRSVANIQFEMIKTNPYRYNSDEVVFQCHAVKKDLTENELDSQREAFFSKGQPCLRASPLTKRYGWGVHYDEEGKIAIYGAESEEYKRLSKDKNLKILKAMRSKKA